MDGTGGHGAKWKWDLGIAWYEEVRDSGNNFFFESLPVGEYTFKYRLRVNLGELDRQLRLAPSCTRFSVEGGWYAVLRVPVMQSDEELAIALLRKKAVVVHPGHFYDFPSDGHLVLSLITEPEVFREGISRLLELIRG